MAVGSRQDNALVTAEVQKADGTWLHLGTFEDRKGGDSDSASVVYNMGGMGVRRALGGRQEPAPITVSRLYDDAAAGVEEELRALCGGASMTITEEALDNEGNSTGKKLVWTGILKKAGKGDYNAEGNAAQTLDLEMIVETAK
jgi:hypothetical protein